MFRTISLTILLLFIAVASFGQVNYAVEMGVGGYLSTAPHSAGNLNILVSNETSRVASFTTVEMRPISLQAPTFTGRTGMQYVVATSGKMDLAGIVQGGGSYYEAGTTASFSGGGKILFYPEWKNFPGLYFAGSIQALGDSSLGWNPAATFWVGYRFTGVAQAVSLSTRRALRRLQGK